MKNPIRRHITAWWRTKEGEEEEGKREEGGEERYAQYRLIRE